MLEQNPKRRGVIETLRYLYESDARLAQRFRYGLLAFDILTVLFIVFTSFIPENSTLEWLDVGFGVLILLDFLARLAISRNRLREVAHPASWADMAAIVSFLAPIAGEAAGFLRILRTVRLLHTYQLLVRLRQDSVWFRRHEDIVLASVNLAVFLFVMSGIVYASQYGRNPGINNYVDALYFTVTALTTTGFGDITLEGTFGRFISIAIMILGVTLFLMLVRLLLQPAKVRFRCPTCALLRHDADAVHCKACGTILQIPDEGY
jgi:voltage-gated potassium channel